MEFLLGSSPSAEISLSRYDPAIFPKFRSVFGTSDSEGSLRYLTSKPEEANTAVVMENHSDRDITALRYCWFVKGDDQSEKRHTASADSYMVDVYHPVLRHRDRKLITLSTTIDESLLDHVQGGGGFIGGGTFYRPTVGVVNSLRFEIDFVLFADGEIAGIDTDKYAAELRCRKPAAEFIVKQIRLAESEHRDVTPVLSALADMPHIGSRHHGQGDPLVLWVNEYARDYLRALGRNTSSVNTPEAKLRHLENRPTLPKFYRRTAA
jgi:hypothetical protein